MSKVLLFMILAARNTNGEDTGWSQLLVFILLAVFWAIGGIMKARAEKARREKEQEEPPARPKPKPSQKTLRQLFEQAAREKYEKAEQRVQAPVPKIRAPKRPVQVKKAKAVTKPAVSLKPVKAGKAEKKLAKEEAESALVSVAESFAIFENTENLKAAILHYEILGQPLGLRGPTEKLWSG